MRQKTWTRQLKKLQKWAFPIIIILLAIAIFLVTSYIKGESELSLDGPVYQYFVEERYEYDENTSILLGEYGIIFSEGEINSSADSTPIYYAEEEKLMLPNAMSWINGETSLETYIPAYSTLVRGSDGYVRVEGDDTILKSGVLYDGNGNFLLLDSCTLTWRGESTSLSTFSFVSTTRSMTRVYDYATETFYVEQGLYSDTKLNSAMGYAINIYTGIFSDGKGNMRLLLASPSALLS